MSTSLVISVFHEFLPPPNGGGNQFLTALCRVWEKDFGISVRLNEVTDQTAAVLFNSFNYNADHLRQARLRFPNLRFVHRVDGPIQSYRGWDDGTDDLIHSLNRECADASIFQSEYSLLEHRRLGLEPIEPVIIKNAPDPTLFKPVVGADRMQGPPWRVILTSWSDNPNKGLDVYEWIDKSIDDPRYFFTFVGRTSYRFQRVRHIPPVPSAQLAQILREHHIYIAASKYDPCSNALLEALACGLPAIYRKSGGHQELVGEAGVGFQKPEELPACLERICGQWAAYVQKINVPDIGDIARQYVNVLLQPRRPYGDVRRGATAYQIRKEKIVRAVRARLYRNRIPVLYARSASERSRHYHEIFEETQRHVITTRTVNWPRGQLIFLPSLDALRSDEWLYYPGVRYAVNVDCCAHDTHVYASLMSRMSSCHGRIVRARTWDADVFRHLRELGMPEGKIWFIPQSVSLMQYPQPAPERVRAIRKSFSVPPQNIVLGILDESKNGIGGLDVEPLGAAVDRLVKKIASLTVIVAAHNTAVFSGVIRCSAASLVHANVRDCRKRFLNWVHACDFVVMPFPTNEEPCAVLRVFACGRPVVTLRGAWATRYVDPGKNGWVVPENTADAWFEALSSIVAQSDAMRAVWSNAAYQTARECDLSTVLPLWRDFLTI